MRQIVAAVLLAFLSGCVITPAAEVEQTIRRDVCTIWLAISYDSTQDSMPTVAEVQANNRARNAYCNPEEDKK